MNRIWLAFAALLMALGAALAAGEPVARIVVQSQQPVLVGQQVRVDVQVLAPNFFMSAPQFPIFDMPGAVVTMPDETGTNFSETIDGQSFAGIKKTYVITPRVAGDLTFPPARIIFKYAAEPGKPPADGAVSLPPEKLSVKLAPGATGPDDAVPVARISITQSLDRSLKGIKAGEALVRTVTTAAEGMQAMMIPPPRFEAPPGVRIYRRDPVMSDGSASRQGFAGGQRIDRVTYVFEKPGDYTLPAVTIDWFNAATGKSETARADEVKLSVAANTAFKPAIAPEPPPAEDAARSPSRPDSRLLLAVLGGALVLAFLIFRLLRWYWPRIRRWAAARRQAREHSEAAAFREVQHAFSQRDRMAAYRALDLWAKRAGAGSIRAWTFETGNTGFQHELDQLEKDLFGAHPKSGSWDDAQSLASEAKAARGKWLADRRKTTITRPALPALNP